MPGFQLTQTYNAPIDVVFARLADFPHAPAHIPGIKRVEMLTNGPVGIGTKFKETRVMFGKEATETMEVTAFEPNSRYELTADSCGALFRTQFQFHAEGKQTRVEVQTHIQAISFWAKLLRPLSWLMMGMVKKSVADDLESMRKSLEPGSVNSS